MSKLFQVAMFAALSVSRAVSVGQTATYGGETIAPAESKFFTPAPSLIDHAALDTLLHASAPVFLLHPDDAITITEYSITGFDIKARLDEDGVIVLPLVGKVALAGLRVTEAEQKVDNELIRHGMVLLPNITIQVNERPGQVVTISGAVAKPGVYSVAGSHSLSDYLSRAGELRDTASSTVTLIRPGLLHPMAIPLGPDPLHSPFREIPLFAGDEVHVSGSGVIYIVGAFKLQGVYPLKSSSPTTVLEAVAEAGGIGYEAAYKDAKIVRTQADGLRTMMSLNLSHIMAGREADIALRNDDILYVPSNQAKAALKGGGAGLIVSLASSYLYATK